MLGRDVRNVLRLERHNIEMTRGDSIRFVIVLEGREIKPGSRALFTVKDTVWEPAGSTIEEVLDVLEGGRVHVLLRPEETMLEPGDYVWDVRLLEPDGEGGTDVLTPMEYGTLRVLEVAGIC